MIFVSVGTDNFQFNRLLEKIDKIAEKYYKKDEVFCQVGYSTYNLKHCQHSDFLSYKEMEQKIKTADIVVIHAGPASIIQVLNANKIPVVVPRLKKYEEVVDDHQYIFTKKLDEEQRVMPVYEIDELEEKIRKYDEIVQKLKLPEGYNIFKNIKEISGKIEEICNRLFQEK